MYALALTAHADAPHRKQSARSTSLRRRSRRTLARLHPQLPSGQLLPDAPALRCPCGRQARRTSLAARAHAHSSSCACEPREQRQARRCRASVEISAEAPVGDDVTIADQSFAPFEVYKKQARVEPPNGDKQRFVFTLELLGARAR